MDQQYGSSVHVSTFPLQPQPHQQSSQHHYSAHSQYQQLYPDYPESCYQAPAFHDPAYHGDQYGYHSTSSVPYGTGIESYLDPKYASNPAAFASRLPYLPFHAAAVAAYGMYDYSFEPAFIRKRNERERQRVKCVNEGYTRLREHLPEEYAEKRLSKVETLRGAIIYIKQLQSLLGFDPEKAPKVKKIRETNEEKPEDRSSHNCSDDHTTKTSTADEMPLTPLCHASIENDNFNELVKKIELSSHESVKSTTYRSKDCFERKEDDSHSRRNCTENESRFSPCTPNHQDSSSRSSLESPPFYSHEYSPIATTSASPTNCSMNERNILNKSCAVQGRSSRLQPEIINKAAKVSSSDIAREQCDWWDRVCNKSHVNTIFDLVDNCSLSSSKHFIPSNTDTVDWVNKNSRHHPYKRFESKDTSLSDNWDDVFQIKVETNTPPPYDERSEFSCQQQYSSCERDFTKTRRNVLRSNEIRKGGQSDGFKTDTSPESLTGLSP